MAFWLLKSEPDCFGWAHHVAEGESLWDGVRNHQAANNLRAMAVGDQALFYHSGKDAAAVGISVVSEAAFPDPTDPTGKWVAVRVRPVAPLPRAVPLKVMRTIAALADMALLRQSRLSVVPVRAEEWDMIVAMGNKLAAVSQ